MMWHGFLGCREKSCIKSTFVCLSVAVCTGKQIQGFLQVRSTHAREQGVEMLKLTPDKLALESEATTPKHCAGGNCLG